MKSRDENPDPGNPAMIFCDDAERARERFLAACGRLGVRVRSYKGRTDGGGGTLYADVARLGAPGAKRAVVIVSGAAGSPGLTCAGIILGCLERGIVRAIPRDVALVLIHAVNPLGPVWPGRPAGIAHDSVDPERDEKPRPSPANWNDTVLAAADHRFADFKAGTGFDRNRLANLTLSSLAESAWNEGTVGAITAAMLNDTERLCVLDIRTGPGPFGEMHLYPAVEASGADWARVATWLGKDPAIFKKGRTIGGAPPGCGFDRHASAAGTAVAIPLVAEFGTYSAQYLLESVAEPGDRASGYPEDPAWRTAVWKAARGLIEGLLAGIGGGQPIPAR